MKLDDEAEAIRLVVDDLAQRCADLEEWQLADARLFAALVEGTTQMSELQLEMCQLVKTSHDPTWCWFEKHAATRALAEIVDDLRVLRMCVRSRIFELEAGRRQLFA